MTSKTPPIDSLALRCALMCSTIARLASAVEAADGVVVDALEVRDGQRRGRAPARATVADLHDVRADLDAERAQERLGQRAAGDARGGLARAGALEDVAHVGRARTSSVPTRSAWPGRGRCTSGTSASTGHGFIRSSQLA